MVRYDGECWSLDLFLSAYGFALVDDLDGNRRAALERSPHRIMAVLEDGTLIQDIEARELPWPQTLAVRARDRSGLNVCDWCKCLTEELLFVVGKVVKDHICEECFDNAEPE